MSELDSFRALEFVTGIPTMTVTKDGVSFNKATVDKLKRPEYVLVLMDDSAHRLAIQTCSQDTTDARPFLKEGRSSRAGVRWNNFDLKMTLQRLMRWNLEDNGYKTEGDYFPEDNAIIFNLDNSHITERSTRRTDTR
ncbi:hypothetical protein [Bifidobacterium cuniculi]|uniref:Uncharacterized protein n=1 Tax=Bifidobacterium cuniculi TaxID=1688 RepID=A0A087ATA9_9BIFI|nr:hypothetical protein [Bifidobacterium cuniculi]KFI62009.1 hypothetical protein BCUN_1721 [Bifidobacterium cuniculi]